ncbi:MAG: hypothetical protein E6899_08530, partial [Neisseria sp.]|nr:hypothetical protein [Neisseria sp.]
MLHKRSSESTVPAFRRPFLWRNQDKREARYSGLNLQWIKFKSGQGDEAADSTDSTEPIHLVLQHLRES